MSLVVASEYDFRHKL